MLVKSAVDGPSRAGRSMLVTRRSSGRSSSRKSGKVKREVVDCTTKGE